jgi:hypothetical protein
MKDYEEVRELKKSLTMAIWKEAIAYKKNKPNLESVHRAMRESKSKRLLELAERWGK